MIGVNNCIICNNNNLHNYKTNYKFISSDIKIVKYKPVHAICMDCGTVQKIKDKKYYKNISIIYKNYDGFKKFNKSDQNKYINGKFTNRCDLIFKKLLKNLKGIKNILDYGSGNGAMINPFLNSKKFYNVFATDYKNNLDKRIVKNKNFKKFFRLSKFTSDKKKFDLITLIHTLEHLTNPKEVLIMLKKKLNNGGKIFIQIPDYSSNPYDLIVYDHTVHYDKSSISKLAKEIGMDLAFISNKILDCEFSFILKKGKITDLNQKKYTLKKILKNFNNSINFLNKQIILLNKLKSFSILGTSITATWVYSSIKKKKVVFLDEDKTKFDLKHMGKKIYDINDNSMFNKYIFLPFPYPKLKKLLVRLRKKYKFNFITPI